MPGADRILARLRRICLALPDTRETLTWGQPHFRVRDKIFAGFGEEGDRLVIGMKLEKAHADVVIREERFWRAPYVGRHGWVSMDAHSIADWGEVEDLIEESYRLIAPKSSTVKLDAPRARPRRRR